MQYFITAIGTDSGKTVVSAVFACAFEASYWKPVQAGEPADTEFIKSIGGIPTYPETYKLKTAASPHFAAAQEGINISISDFTLPTKDALIIEGAGGILVPLNSQDMMIDLSVRLNLPVILVCNLYLGSINHSLLSIDYLKRSKASVAGIVFNGVPNPSSEEVIRKFSPWPVLLHIPPLPRVSTAEIHHLASLLRRNRTLFPTG